MRRRRFIANLAVAPAIPVVAQQAFGQQELPKLEFAVPDAGADPTPKFFSKPQFAALSKLGDLVLPAINGTPGALAARAPEFLDFLLGESPADRQKLYRDGLDALNAQSRRKFAKSFADLDTAQADQILAPLHQKWTYADPVDPLAAFLRAAKADILAATVNSREWVAVVSQRNRGASGTGIYWKPVE
jgi:hypothetical protein